MSEAAVPQARILEAQFARQTPGGSGDPRVAATSDVDPRVAMVLEVLDGREAESVAAEWDIEAQVVHRWVRDFLVAGLDPAAAYSPSTIEAPVFEPDGSIALGLVLVGLPRTMSGAEIESMAERLVAATTALSATLR